MKKRLGISELSTHEVPVELDVRIMARASFSIRQRRVVRRRQSLFLSAAAAVCIAIGLTAYNMLLTAPAPISSASHLTSANQMDLAALGDLSHLEQEMFVLDQTSIALSMYDFEDIQM